MQLLDSLQKWQLIAENHLAECLCLRKSHLAECLCLTENHHLIKNHHLINQPVLINICYMLYRVLPHINLRKCIILNVIIKHGVGKRIIGVGKRIIGVEECIMGKRIICVGKCHM